MIMVFFSCLARVSPVIHFDLLWGAMTFVNAVTVVLLASEQSRTRTYTVPSLCFAV